MKLIPSILIILLYISLTGCETDYTPIWNIKKEGTIERVEYFHESLWESSKTTCYFTDGSNYIVYGIKAIPGKEIIIEVDQKGNWRIRKKDK